MGGHLCDLMRISLTQKYQYQDFEKIVQETAFILKKETHGPGGNNVFCGGGHQFCWLLVICYPNIYDLYT